MKQRKIPMRMCIGCKEMHPKKELIRIVIPKDGAMDTDETGKAHGRGVYICRDMACFKRVERQKNLRLPAELLEKIAGEIDAATR